MDFIGRYGHWIITGLIVGIMTEVVGFRVTSWQFWLIESTIPACLWLISYKERQLTRQDKT